MLFLAKTLQDYQKFHDVRCPKVSDFFFEFVLNLLFIEGIGAPVSSPDQPDVDGIDEEVDFLILQKEPQN